MAFTNHQARIFSRATQRSICSVLIVVLLISGCATAAHPPTRGVDQQLLTTIGEADRKACREFARKVADGVEGQPLGPGWNWWWLPLAAVVNPVGVGLMLLAAPPRMIVVAHENQKMREAVHDEAMIACLNSTIAGQSLGPEDLQVAEILRDLADRYAKQEMYDEAKLLYRRALAIREKALGPEHPDMATTLQDYAALLRKTHQEAEAAEIEDRVRAIGAECKLKPSQAADSETRDQVDREE